MSAFSKKSVTMVCGSMLLTLRGGGLGVKFLGNSNHTAHRRVRGNTLVEFEANRANGFRANRETDRNTDRQTDRDLPNYSMIALMMLTMTVTQKAM